jgi:MFS transporter, DHA3 family, macrolide efflux protein
LIGLLLPMFQTPFTVLIQTGVEEQFMGRVFSVLGMIPNLVMPLAMLFYGPIADLVRIEWLLIFTGALLFVLGFFILGNRNLVKAGIPTKTAETDS